MLREYHDRLDAWLQGEPDRVITILLLLTALFGVAVALAGPRVAKVGLILYWWLP